MTRAARVLLACFVCQMGLGFGYVFGATLKHVVADLAWSRAAFAGGSACLLLSMGLSAPVLGSLSERFGARGVVSAVSAPQLAPFQVVRKTRPSSVPT